METLETDRLILRPWRESDLEDLYEYAKDPEVGPNAGWKPHGNREETRKILHSFEKDGEVWAIALRETGKVIGSLGLHPDRLRHEGMGPGREAGYVLSHAYWGRGLMTEAVRRAVSFAFGGMDLEFLSVAHFPWNRRSKRVIEKCGFRYEKYLKQSYSDYAGTRQDEVCYLLTREEYFAAKRAEFHAAPLTREQAAETCGWKYPGPYAAYNSPGWETACAQNWAVADDEKRARRFFAVLDEDGAFCGYFRLTPENGAVMLGLGMKPGCCGAGNGRKVMALILKSFRGRYPGETLELEVRDWNRRAVSCYEKAGFVKTAHYFRRAHLGEGTFFRMRYQGSSDSGQP